MKTLKLIICVFLFIQTSKAQNNFLNFNITNKLFKSQNINYKPGVITQHARVAPNALQCQLQLSTLINDITAGEAWALAVFDSWGKIPSGIQSGNTFEMGHYDQCLATKIEMPSAIQGTFEGQYCLVPVVIVPTEDNLEIVSQLPPLYIGTCIPAVCEPAMVQTILNEALANINISMYPQELDNWCTQSEADPLTDLQIAGISFFSIIVGLMILCTAYEVITINFLNKTPIIWLALFSIYTNGQSLFSLKKSKSRDVIHCLNGIRTFSIIWVVFGHTHEFLSSFPSINIQSFIPDLVTNPYGMLIIHAGAAVDSFFVLSGLLVTCSVLRELDKSKWLNIPVMYLHRIIRLVPVLAAVILFSLSILPLTGDGPVWKYTLNITNQQCKDNWWATLLFIQNYYVETANEMCLSVTWYLAIDMQLFILSPILLIVLWKWRSKAVWIIPTLVALQMGCVFAIFYIHKYTFGLVHQMTAPLRGFDIYNRTHTRYASWVIGVGLGYLIHYLKDKRVTLSIYTVISGWVVSFGLIAAVMFGSYDMQQPENTEKLINAAMFETFRRPIWCLALAWIIFACHRGYGGPINTFLSLSIWQPFAKLSYSLYLVHIQFITMAYSTQRLPIYLKFTHLMHSFWGDFGFSLAGAVFLTLAFEMPFVTIEKILFKKITPSKTPTQSTANIIEPNVPTQAEVVIVDKLD